MMILTTDHIVSRYPPNTVLLLYDARISSEKTMQKLMCVETRINRTSAPVLAKVKRAHEPWPGEPCKYIGYLAECSVTSEFSSGSELTVEMRLAGTGPAVAVGEKIDILGFKE